MSAVFCQVDPEGAALLADNLALLPGESLAKREFTSCLCELAPVVGRLGWRCSCRSLE